MRLDTAEDISRCLNCDRPDCDNCIEYGGRVRKKYKRPVEMLDAEGNVVARYANLTEASAKARLCNSTICIAIKQDRAAGGYFWRYAE